MKAFISAILASLTIAGPALASPLPADHQTFLNTLKADGIKVMINEPANACYDGSNRNGAYSVYRGKQYLVVCQDKRNQGEFSINDDVSFIAPWTSNDLDTIRHEGFHIIQDCMDGTKGDQELDTVFTSLSEVIDEYGVINSMRIMNSYLRAYGPSRHADIKYEIEAFYAARNYSATELNSMYKKYCSY